MHAFVRAWGCKHLIIAVPSKATAAHLLHSLHVNAYAKHLSDPDSSCIPRAGVRILWQLQEVLLCPRKKAPVVPGACRQAGVRDMH